LLVLGWPAPALLPSEILLKATGLVLTDPILSTPALQYAPDWGHDQLRIPLASFLSSFHSPLEEDPITKDRLAVTGGASHSLGIALSTLTDPGYTRAVWVCEPTYYLAFRIINDSGLAIRSVEDGEEGIDFDRFRRQLEAAEKEAVQKGKTGPASGTTTTTTTTRAISLTKETRRSINPCPETGQPSCIVTSFTAFPASVTQLESACPCQLG
jgi:DNA-binding transcriptional MocR family regulator